MKNLKFSKVSKYFLYTLLVLVLTNCTKDSKTGINKDRFDGLILTDLNTNKTYLLRYNIGKTYFIDELQVKIIGKDTTHVFR